MESGRDAIATSEGGLTAPTFLKPPDIRHTFSKRHVSTDFILALRQVKCRPSFAHCAFHWPISPDGKRGQILRTILVLNASGDAEAAPMPFSGYCLPAELTSFYQHPRTFALQRPHFSSRFSRRVDGVSFLALFTTSPIAPPSYAAEGSRSAHFSRRDVLLLPPRDRRAPCASRRNALGTAMTLAIMPLIAAATFTPVH